MVFLFISLNINNNNYHLLFPFLKKKPKISVFIPIYNREIYINKCIQSLQSQTLKDIEIIAVNDYSNDSSLNILNELRSLTMIKIMDYYIQEQWEFYIHQENIL